MGTVLSAEVITFLALALCCAGMGVLQFLAVRRLWSSGVRTSGRVVRHLTAPNGEGSLNWWPVIEFEAEGQTVSIRGRVDYGGLPHYRVGQQVPVLYPRSRPAKGRIALRWELRLEWLAWELFAALFVVLALQIALR